MQARRRSFSPTRSRITPNFENELASLKRRYGQPRTLTHTLPDVSFGPLNRSREAEVAMAIRRLNGKFLLQTKSAYPEGVFRLPTGGLKRNEGIENALLRETEEETALEVDVARFVAILRYLSPAGNPVFQSYLFVLDERGGMLRAEEPSEGITGWLEADASTLGVVAQRLRECTGEWRSWGSFRALAIDALVPALQDGSRRPAEAPRA